MPRGRHLTSEQARAMKEKAKGRGPGKFTTIKESVLAVFQELQKDPKQNLKAFAKKYPRDFHNICAKLIPTEIVGKGGGNLIPQNISTLSFEQLLAIASAGPASDTQPIGQAGSQD